MESVAWSGAEKEKEKKKEYYVDDLTSNAGIPDADVVQRDQHR